jgi:hypothetical protein
LSYHTKKGIDIILLITEKNNHHSVPPFGWFKPCQKSFRQQEQLCNCHEVLKQPKKLLVRELWLHAISLLSLDKNVYLLFHWRLLSYYSPATVTR